MASPPKGSTGEMDDSFQKQTTTSGELPRRQHGSGNPHQTDRRPRARSRSHNHDSPLHDNMPNAKKNMPCNGNNNRNATTKLSETSLHKANGKVPGTRQTGTDGSFMVTVILRDAQRRYKLRHTKEGRRRQTLFYRFVRGGDIDAVRDVINQLSGRMHRNERDWLLGTRIPPPAEGLRKVMESVWNVCRMLCLVITAVVLLALGPVFYPLHAAAVYACDKLRKRISVDIDLPLAFAALSCDIEMIKLFRQEGVSMTQTDSGANNVFHYLADFSVEKPELSIESLHVLLQAYSDQLPDIYDVMTQQTNSGGLTAMEQALRHGSPRIFEAFANVEGILKKTVMTIGKHGSKVGSDEIDDLFPKMHGVGVITKGNPEISAPSLSRRGSGSSSETSATRSDDTRRYRLIRYDVTRYESADIMGKQSRLLLLLTCKDFENMPEADMDTLGNICFLREWARMKVSSVMWVMVLRNLMSVIFTVVLIVLLVNTDGDDNVHPLRTMFDDQLASVRLHAKMEHMASTSQNGDVTDTPHIVGDVTDITVKIDHSNAINDATAIDATDIGRSVTNRNNNTRVVNMFSTLTLDGNDKQPTTTDPSDSQSRGISLPGDGDEPDFCVGEAQEVAGVVLDSCQYEAFLYLQEQCLGRVTDDVILRKSALKPLLIDFHLIGQIKIILCIISAAFVISELLTRLVFIVRRFSLRRGAVSSSLYQIMSCRLPGSYFDRGCRFINSVMFVTYLEVVKPFAGGQVMPPEEVIWREAAAVYLINGVFLLSFAQLIWALRLLPAVGTFIISIFYMGRDLANFLVVYAFVLVAFSSIFQAVMRDPDCPAIRQEAFTTLPSSAFQAFNLMLGQGDFAYDTSDAALYAYISYSIIVILLLLNLIIAVMSRTADTVMSSPWRETLQKMEILGEALEQEANLLCWTFPCRKWLHRKRMESTGYVIRNGETPDADRRVFIEVEEEN